MSGNRLNGLKDIIIKKPFAKRMILMLIGVLIMGICVAVLNMTNLGVDPFAAVSYGLSDITGISFGTIELIFNGILLIIVLLFDFSRLGFGTIGNMVLVGYTADFTTYIMGRMGIAQIDNRIINVVVMLIALTVFIFAVALYINAGLGASAYDALPYIIHDGICKKTSKNVRFKFVRIAFDAFFTIVAFLIRGAAGVITVLMVVALGPVIELVSKWVNKALKLG